MPVGQYGTQHMVALGIAFNFFFLENYFPRIKSQCEVCGFSRCKAFAIFVLPAKVRQKILLLALFRIVSYKNGNVDRVQHKVTKDYAYGLLNIMRDDRMGFASFSIRLSNFGQLGSKAFSSSSIKSVMPSALSAIKQREGVKFGAKAFQYRKMNTYLIIHSVKFIK